MRTFFSLFSLVALATTGVISSPVPEPQCLSELCGTTPLLNSSPSPSDVAASIARVGTPTRSLPERDVEQLTNGERFIRGLPPKKPKHLRGSPTRRSEASVAPATLYRGYIRVDRADGTGELGYLSRHPFSGAQHRYQDISNAMVVNFKFDDAQTTGPASEMTTENSDIQSTFPLLGLIQGRDNTDSDLRTGSYQYLYFGGVDPTSPNATPQNVANSYSAATGTARTAESEVWTFNRDTNQLIAQWVNPDGTKATTHLFTQSTAMYAGGDSGSFVSRYPSPIITVTYTFVPL